MSKRPAWWLPVLAKIWPITWNTAKATAWPVVGKLIAKLTVPFFSDPNLNITYLPINKEIKGAESSYLPQKVVEELIRRSAHRVIINRCTCRDALQCENHPVDFGCMLLGEGAKEIDPRIARHVSVQEAGAHLHRTIEDGLIPMAGRVKIDNYIWGVRDRGKLLTICHCCRCCCTILASAKYFPDQTADALRRLSGLAIRVDHDRCTQCGVCIDECFIGAYTMQDAEIVHDLSRCKGCGRCVAVCPEDALLAEVEDVDAAVDEVTGRISQMIDFE
jgi:UDP-glucose 4-epimerase